MAASPLIDLTVNKRTPADFIIPEMGANYTGATLFAEVRAEPGADGTALITLNPATPPAEGLSVTYDAGYVDPEGIMPDGASLVRIIIAEATLEGLAYGADASKPVVLYYDIHLTPSGGTKFVFCSGTFTVDPGVTV